MHEKLIKHPAKGRKAVTLYLICVEKRDVNIVLYFILFYFIAAGMNFKYKI